MLTDDQIAQQVTRLHKLILRYQSERDAWLASRPPAKPMTFAEIMAEDPHQDRPPEVEVLYLKIREAGWKLLALHGPDDQLSVARALTDHNRGAGALLDQLWEGVGDWWP